MVTNDRTMINGDRIREFFGGKQDGYSSAADVLKNIADTKGTEVFLNREELTDSLRAGGLSEGKILQILLMVSVPGFKELMEADERTMENDLDRYVQNAGEETGLSREHVLGLAADISYALGYSMVQDYYQYRRIRREKHAFAVPYKVYERELSPISQAVREGRTLSEEEQKVLTQLAEEGIPEAEMYLSDCLKGSNDAKALELLESAAADGLPEAQAKLGDYYYEAKTADGWERAYECYTGYGAVAMNRDRQIALKNILNHQKYNRKVLALSLLFFAGILLTIILKPAAAVYGTAAVLRTIALIAEVGVWGAAAVHYRAHPFTFLNWLIPAMFGIWWVYLLIWLL